jgi:hypothetical protein
MSDSKPTIHEYNCLTGISIEREMTDEEIANLPQPSDLPLAE